MERITISLEEALAAEFDRLSEARGYESRSEAIRDLIRRELEAHRSHPGASGLCVANLSYVYDHHSRELGERLMQAQHDHHELVVSTMHAHLDHASCLETVILRGPVREVRHFADHVIAERGVRHGVLNIVSVDTVAGRRGHGHAHLRPKD